MFRKRFNNKKVDIESVNGALSLTNKILKIAYILIVIIGIYAITLIAKSTNSPLLNISTESWEKDAKILIPPQNPAATILRSSG